MCKKFNEVYKGHREKNPANFSVFHINVAGYFPDSSYMAF